MQNKNCLVRYLAFSIALTVTFFFVSCTHKVVIIGSPYERYDHNRTQKIVIALHDGADKNITTSVIDEVYIPSGSPYFPTAQYKERGSETDKLPVANVVPTFTGVSLPLSSAPAKEGSSDREDIIDFLAEGPYAQAGVQPGETTGDTKSAEIAYKPVLDLLGSKEQLTMEREQIIERLSHLDINFADEIIDSRYRLRSFADVLAFRYEEFWFILYKLPDSNYYSRLAVVPVPKAFGIRGQNFPGKRP